MDRIEQLNESRFAIFDRNLASPVAGNDLAQQSDFFHPSRNQLSALGDDISNPAAPFGPSGIGDDAKRAILIAALHDADKGGHSLLLLAIQQMLADGRLAALLVFHINNFLAPSL